MGPWVTDSSKEADLKKQNKNPKQQNPFTVKYNTDTENSIKGI